MDSTKDFLINKNNIPIRRCPDFDNDCKEVYNKFKCYEGQMEFNGKEVVYTEKSKGYCPFLS